MLLFIVTVVTFCLQFSKTMQYDKMISSATEKSGRNQVPSVRSMREVSFLT